MSKIIHFQNSLHCWICRENRETCTFKVPILLVIVYVASSDKTEQLYHNMKQSFGEKIISASLQSEFQRSGYIYLTNINNL